MKTRGFYSPSTSRREASASRNHCAFVLDRPFNRFATSKLSQIRIGHYFLCIKRSTLRAWFARELIPSLLTVIYDSRRGSFQNSPTGARSLLETFVFPRLNFQRTCTCTNVRSPQFVRSVFQRSVKSHPICEQCDLPAGLLEVVSAL